MRTKAAEHLVLVAGCAVSVAVGSVLAAWHLPGDNPGWRGAAGIAGEVGIGRAYHFLAEDCGCSERIEQWLKAEQTRTVRYGKSWPMVIVKRDRRGEWRGWTAEGDAIRDIPAGEGIRVAPWLVVTGAGGETLYAGGYDKAPIHGERIFEELAKGRKPAKRGVRGCAVEAEARQASMLLRWKEWWKRI